MNESGWTSTSKAARILGVSTTLVQKMLDRKEIAGWKTRGGHRRILIESLTKYLESNEKKLEYFPIDYESNVAMILVESVDLVNDLRESGSAWSLPFELNWQNTFEIALAELFRVKPFIVVAEINRSQDFLESVLLMMNAVQKSQPKTLFAVIGDASNRMLGAKSQIQFVKGPLTADWLHGFLRGVEVTRAAWQGCGV